MLYEVMKYLHNFFATKVCEKGTYTITDGVLDLPFVKDGQYIYIEGSTMNDGVYKYPLSGLTDEEFDGFITLLKPPKAFLDLVAEIEGYEADNVASPYQSESFGGYSYTRATNKSGEVAGWKDVFASRLGVWRKI
jgi:hypothetical protein